ncbi:MAG: hypothetical protein U9O54_05740 [Chloroflexota bacterium]|nr:hypothetical protein [Chloroflexota bacterium]
MDDVLIFLKEYEVLIYLAMGLFAAWHVRKFSLAWQELQGAAFGLEKESAQGRLNRAAGFLVLALIFGVVEFGLVTIAAPSSSETSPLFTPTLDLLSTPTVTLLAADSAQAEAETPEPILAAGCIPDEVMITFPENETTVSGLVEVLGTVSIPNFAYYKFEISQTSMNNWLTIQANDKEKNGEVLGTWDTAQLEPGSYDLRLVVVDNEGNQRVPCVVSVYVEAITED